MRQTAGSNWQDVLCQLCPRQHGAYDEYSLYLDDTMMAVDDSGESSARAGPWPNNPTYFKAHTIRRIQLRDCTYMPCRSQQPLGKRCLGLCLQMRSV
jgi:hypothetical protein